MIIMNLRNKLYETQFSHHPVTDSQSVPEQQSWNAKLVNSLNSVKLLKETECP